MLRLSNFADYGVVVMTAAARAAGEGILISATRVSEESGIPYATAAKLLGHLGRAGLLVSQRGAGGGFGLARDAGAISLADIIEAIDGPIGLTHCSQPDSICDLSPGCTVRPHWEPVNRAVRDALANVTLADMTPAATDFAADFPEKASPELTA